MNHNVIEAWHSFVKTGDSAAFKAFLADDVTFHSPVVHTPQQGVQITLLYLQSARDVLSGSHFNYVRELVSEQHAVLEFTAEIQDVVINGVDMISWDRHDRITDFKVMIRPLKAINMIHQEMAARLQAYTERQTG